MCVQSFDFVPFDVAGGRDAMLKTRPSVATSRGDRCSDAVSARNDHLTWPSLAFLLLKIPATAREHPYRVSPGEGFADC